jgi:hypothetical protein
MGTWFINSGQHRYTEPCLLRVCKLINKEATPIFYSNTINFNIKLGDASILHHTMASLQEFIGNFPRSRPYNFRKLLLNLDWFIPPADAIHEEENLVNMNLALEACYLSIIDMQCGTLDHFHTQISWKEDETRDHYASNEITDACGIIDARKVSVHGLKPYPAAALQWVVGENGRIMPPRGIFENLERVLRDNRRELQLEFSEQYPDMFKEYNQSYEDSLLGTLFLVENNQYGVVHNKHMINFEEECPRLTLDRALSMYAETYVRIFRGGLQVPERFQSSDDRRRM